MRNMTVNPAAHGLITAWVAAKDCERQWAEHRRNLEEQILSLHPSLVADLEQTLVQNSALSTSVAMEALKVEVKRTIEIDQDGTAQLIQQHPDLWGTVFRAKYEVASSKALFGLLATPSPLSEAVSKLLTFKSQRPYFALSK
jgi:hypothetical protein